MPGASLCPPGTRSNAPEDGLKPVLDEVILGEAAVD